MHLFAGRSIDFIKKSTQNLIAGTLADAYQSYYRRAPSPGERGSWQNSLLQMAVVLERGAFVEHGVILEYELPLSSMRLDCMITGTSRAGSKEAVVVELKQWSNAEASETPDCVRTYINKGIGDHLHPSKQVERYAAYLRDCHMAFSNNLVGLRGCSYLHNLSFDHGSEIFAQKFAELASSYPSFAGDQQASLIEFLDFQIGGGHGLAVLEEVLSSKIRPSRKLMENTKEMVRGQSRYVLLDDQLVAFNNVMLSVEAAVKRQRKKSAFIINGGPGTGKSVVALQLLGELAGRGYAIMHATGSRAFTNNLKALAGRGGQNVFKYFNNFAMAAPNTLDCLIMDEAHRIRATSVDRFTRKDQRSGKAQINELLDAAKVTVFLLDDLQVVRPNEVGSRTLIKEAAVAANIALREFDLQSQFRCSGSDGFINWIDNTLGVRETANVIWKTADPYEFKIFDSVEALEFAIRRRANDGFTARLMAGFCWPWSAPKPDGHLVTDVKIGDWARPWNARSDASARLADGVPGSDFWATDPGGIDQVGCVYTAQGFEFDYAGVIVGKDFVRDLDGNFWRADRTASADTGIKRGTSEAEFLRLVRQVYRVLMTRGMKGCYVYFMDEATRRFFLSRTE